MPDSSPTPPRPDEEIRRARRRMERYVFGGFIGLIGVLLLVWGPDLVRLRTTVPTSEYLLVASVTVILLLGALVLLLLLLRYVFRIYLEGRWRTVGYRLRTRLVLLFLAFTLIPTLLLFLVSRQIIFETVDRWFNLRIEQQLAEALEVAEVYYDGTAESAARFGENMMRGVLSRGLMDKRDPKELNAYIQSKLSEYGLSHVEIYFAKTNSLIGISNPDETFPADPRPDLELLREGLQGNSYSRVQPTSQGVWVRVIVPIEGANAERRAGAMVVNRYLPENLLSRMERVSATYNDYRRLIEEKQPIKTWYLLALITVCLAIVLASTWIGYALARSLTVPIMQLVDATGRVADGDLEVRVETSGRDEIGQLVDGFNRMTQDLKQSKDALETAYRELQKSSREIKERRQFVERVLETVTSGVISFDRFGVITGFNRAAESILGLPVADALNRHYLEVLGGGFSNPLADLLEELDRSQGESDGRLEKTVHWSRGDVQLTLVLHLAALRQASGRFLGVVAVFENITELLKSQRAEAWREVARRIAHEVKNPLTPIQLSAQRLQRRLADDLEPERKALLERCVTTIAEQVDQMKRMVNEFSAFARIPETRVVPGRIHEVIEETVDLYRQAHKRVEFELRLDPEMPVFEFDAEQMHRVFVNLIDNAIASFADGGRIEIETRYRPEWRLARIDVMDDGPGIAPEIRERIFEPYVTSRAEGTGLGLSIVNTIIADHHGYIRALPRKPRGTVFSIELPARPVLRAGGEPEERAAES